MEIGMKDPIIHQPSNLWGAQLIGTDTTIGAFCDIGDDVVIGTGCKIQCHVSIPPLTRIGNDVFLGPGVKIINDKHMDGDLKGITIGNEARIGAGAIIGANIGNYAIVGMGAVVVYEVVEGTTVIGNPAKAIIR